MWEVKANGYIEDLVNMANWHPKKRILEKLLNFRLRVARVALFSGMGIKKVGLKR